MKNMKSTKRSLFLSAMALLLCTSMLIGTTYAWFTESITSNKNIITGGNMDVELYWTTTPNDDNSWAKVNADTNVFMEGALWEPGHTEVVYLKVANEGTLSLKYRLGVNIESELAGINVDGNMFKLSDYVKYSVIDGTVTGNRATLVGEAEANNATEIKTATTKTETLYPKGTAGKASEQIVTMVVYMPEIVGNEANYKQGTIAPTLNLGISLYATQFTWEKDSFDECYDQDTAVFTVEDANEMMAEGKDTTLVNCIDPQGVLEVPADYTGTLTVVNSTVKSVQGAGDVNLVILGDVTVNAKPAATTFAATNFDGSAITAKGKLSISGEGNLTAIAADVTGAFGIGGMTTTEISIKDITIDYASGSFVQPDFKNDTKYGKTEPEGGAAIGSGYNGAKITLNKVNVLMAEGGSKAAAIGARYWTGVTINVTDSTIVNAFGGNASAGIGGSRVSEGATENEKITINITNSTVTAKGGAYGAGIGSGYDTHCQDSQPLCTINIEGSTINATGGKYAAGVGTGYHNAALAGEIKNSTVTAASGEKWYKDTYTSAMDIGFGVTDPTREGKQTDSKIVYNGETIALANAPVFVYVADGVFSSPDGNTYYISNRAGYTWMDAQADNFFGRKTIKLAADIDFDGETITSVKFWNSHPIFDGQGHTLSNFVIGHSGSKTGSGLFTGTFSVKNLVVDGAHVTGDYAGAISGWMYGDIDNCTVKNSTIVCTYWQGGGLAGQYNQGNVTNCIVDNCTISGGAAVGGLIGILNETKGERKVENCTVKNTTVVQEGGWGGDYDKMFGVAVGLINIENSEVYFTNCTVEGCTVKGEASDVLYGLAESGTTVTVN